MELIKCPACDYVYDKQKETKKPSWEQEPCFLQSAHDVHFYNTDGDLQRFTLYACPKCKVVHIRY